MCLDMPSPDVQGLFDSERKKSSSDSKMRKVIQLHVDEIFPSVFR